MYVTTILAESVKHILVQQNQLACSWSDNLILRVNWCTQRVDFQTGYRMMILQRWRILYSDVQNKRMWSTLNF